MNVSRYTHKCNICGQKFTSLDAANKHVDNRHANGALWVEGNVTMWAGMSDEAAYTIICETHCHILEDNNKSVLKRFMSTSTEFCGGCQEPELWCETCGYIVTYETMKEHEDRLHSTEVTGLFAKVGA